MGSLSTDKGGGGRMRMPPPPDQTQQPGRPSPAPWPPVLWTGSPCLSPALSKANSSSATLSSCCSVSCPTPFTLQESHQSREGEGPSISVLSFIPGLCDLTQIVPPPVKWLARTEQKMESNSNPNLTPMIFHLPGLLLSAARY